MDTSQFYADLKKRLVEWAEEQADIRAIILVGSQARQIKPADDYADLDLNVFVTESSTQSQTFIDWMRDYAPLWMVVLEHWDEDTFHWLMLYQGGIKVDFTTCPNNQLQELVDKQDLWDDMIRGYEILLDKDGLAAQLPSAKPLDPPAYTAPTQEQFSKRVENFFYGAVYLAKQIKRENLWKIKWADQYQQTMLLEMLEWHAHASHDAHIDTYYRGDFMRDWVSAETWDELYQVYAHFDAEDSQKALMASIRLFVRLTEETAAKLNYDYPKQMVGEVIKYLQKL